MKVLLVDFYDSFTFNIHHYLWSEGAEVVVVQHDNLELSILKGFSHVILSPGPGLPKEKVNMFEIIGAVNQKTALLGICLGMQAIAENDGGQLYNLDYVRHGVTSRVNVSTPSKLFDNIPESFEVGLYHSWAVDGTTLKNYKITAISDENIVMAIEHNEKRICGVQFHPESILTSEGKKIFNNFLLKG